MCGKHADYYIVSAGKYDEDGEENYKYAGAPIRSFDEALAEYNDVKSYPWARINVFDANSQHLCTIS